MGCLFGRQPHIGNSRADILGANIKAIEIFDGFANFMHQFRCRVIGQYGTFATAKVQPGKAGLVRHTLAEPQGIDQGSVFTLVGKDTTAAQRRAEFCVMDRNTTIKLIIITKYHHSFIAIGGNLSDFEHYRLLKILWDSGKFLQKEFAVDLMQADGAYDRLLGIASAPADAGDQPA
jgi:hypothetical protein